MVPGIMDPPSGVFTYFGIAQMLQDAEPLEV